MKSFVIASVIMLIIIALVTANSIAVIHSADKLLTLSSQIESGSSAGELTLEWQSCRKFLLLSNHRSDITRADEAIILMLTHDLSSETGKAALRSFISAVTTIRENQRLTFDTIF